MNRNDKNKKFTPLNINNVFKGKSVELQNKPSYKLGGMQTLGKVSSMRRVPPPKWVPSLKAETGVSDGRQIITQSSSGWVNPVTSQDNVDSNTIKSQGVTSKILSDKSQWNSKLTTNKPFFLIGQEFPSLQSDSGPESSQDITKEKLKENEIKSKIDDLRNRDANISVSTLNRIDALSISKSSKGDIAATGWAAEDEEPNFDEKIVFSDEDSSNEGVHNWHSDNDEAGNKSERIEKRESIDMQPIISDVWHDQSTAASVIRYSQFQQMPVNVQGQFINPSQFPPNHLIGRNPVACTMGNIVGGSDEQQQQQSAFMNSVAEQRNARNMEYYFAIERARQKKLATQSTRGPCGLNDDHNQQLDPAASLAMRSRHTSITSDTTESMNTAIEMGPPGGPPMMHHLHKPHLQPQISPMIHPHNISVISPSIPQSSMFRFTSHPFNIMPMSTVPMETVDSKLMEKFVEFLKLQSTNEGNPDSPMNSEHAQTIRPHESEIKTIPESNIQQHQQEIERPQSHVSSLGGHGQVDKENLNTDKFTGSNIKDNSESIDKELQRKSKSNYSHEDDNQKYDQSKKGVKNKNFKEYRPNKTGYRGDYSINAGGSGNTIERDYYPENNDVMAYEDYNTYKQHYARVPRGYNRNPSFNYYSDQYSSQSKDNFANDYHYKSNSLKTKSSTSKSKDSKPSGSNADHIQSDRESSNIKKYENQQEAWPHENDIIDCSDKKNKDPKKNPKAVKSVVYQPKKFDNRYYKEKPTESAQEYSMGFAVNPKENRKNYYPSNYNRRYYTDYSYYNSSANYNEYDDENSYYQDNYYSQEYYGYDKDYSSNKYPNKRNPKTSNTGDQWRQNKDEKSNNPRNTETTNSTNQFGNPNSSQSKTVNRNNRKSDKRQFSNNSTLVIKYRSSGQFTYASKDSNDNDQEEWETASEGGSVRSNSAPRDMHKLHMNRQNNSQLNATENKVMSNSNNENRKVAMNKNGSNYSCNGGNSLNDNNGNQDGSGGAPGSSGGTRFRSSASQNKSVDSSQSKNIDKSSNENRNSDSTSKNCSNNNNSNKDNLFNTIDSRQADSFQRSNDIAHMSSPINLDKYAEFIEEEEMLYENAQFQEVLSKATKKSRKLEEQKRLKEEYRLEQKRLEALKNKSKSDYNQIRKPSNRRDQPPRTNKTETSTGHKFENKPAINIRDKETLNNPMKKWEINKVAMQIGSWDNSLADEITSEKKAPPKPIGTPASIPAWNKKTKTPFETSSSNACQNSLSTESIKMPTDIETISQTFSSENSEVNFNPTSYNSYNNSIYNQPARTSEENKIETSIEKKSAEITIHENINFEYDVKNINCEKNHRNLLSTDRNLHNNDQKLLNDKINSVKTIWDNLPVSNITPESKATISSPINQDVDIHTGQVSINQEVTNTRNIDNNLSSSPVPIPNVCKVKPQLQQDFKKDHNEIILTSQAIQIRNSPAAFLSQNQGGFLPYRFPDFLQESLHPQEAYTSLISNNQPGMHINYNLPNTHLIDSSLLRQNTQEQMLSNKMNFINQSQSSFYPQQATTPKLMSNTPGQLPINMDIGSAHAPAHHMQQLLLTRQNSLTSSMMQPNPMTIPFIQSGQQPIQAQTPLFPTTPILGATNFSSQINPFSQGHLQPHYPHGNFPSLHHTPQFQPNHQQMLLNQHQHHHHQQQQQQQQQLIQGQLSHDRVINSGQSGVFNSVIGPSDISTNTGLSDFNGQPKPINHNNIMHGMNGSAFVLPHNLNILMKPSMFATNSQYNTFTTPIQSNLLNLKNGFDHNTNIKSLDLDHYRHDNPMNDRNIYCGDNTQLQKSNDEYYQDVSEYDNCDINYENWMPNLRYSKVDIYTANNLMSTFDFHSQKSPMQFSPMEPGGDAATYRNFITPFRDNHTSLAAAGLPTNANLQYIISPRLKSQYNQDQSAMINRQHSKCYDNQNFISNNFNSKIESIDNKILIKCTSSCGGPNSISEVNDNSKDISNTEKSITESKKNSKQRTSYSDNFDEKNQSWSLMEDDRSVPQEDNKSSIKSSNTENSSHSPNKHFTIARPNNNFDNQCQYGYDETQLSSQTAESLRKFDHDQLKKVIMKLREGPVMTDTNCNEFDFAPYKGATIPRLMPLQSSVRNKPSKYNNSFSSDIYNNSDNNVGLGFYSRNRALTPPAAQYRTYRNKTNNNRHINSSLLPNNNNNNPIINNNNNNNNRISRQKCDNIITNTNTNPNNNNNNTTDAVVVVVDSDDLRLNTVQSKSLDCDNLVLENIIDNSIL